MNHFFSAVLLMLTTLFSTDHSRDVIKPSINLISPVDAVRVMQGETVIVNALVKDNQVLKDFQIKITKGGDSSLCFARYFSCNHMVNAKRDAKGNDIPVISGKKETCLEFAIGVDENAVVGDYYFQLEVEDESGNRSMKKVGFYIERN
ncbi:DUF4625 domain-containing protein [Marinifilum fragile]|uniref:DUF4625 domain-containing protein n=1 Tax=Marinifilum fragile TaxID=570161 RepID=UPI002AA66AC2|nr:DUF4625 domain-containing protein [Marinifilum fragile]